MKKIFIGMLLVFLNFDINIGSIKIGLIPSFLGYIYMFNGLSEIKYLSDKFLKTMPYVKVMAIYSVILYAMDLLSISHLIPQPISFILGLASTVLSFFISYSIIMGIKDIEILKMQDLNSDKLYSTWKLLVIFTSMTFLSYVFPALALIFIMISFIIVIYYLYIFNITKNLFYEKII